MGENGAVEELLKKFTTEVGSPGIFSRKATREKYLREAITWGYKGREGEFTELKVKQRAEIAAMDKAIAELKEKAVEKPAISPREYNLQLEAKYQKSRAEAAIEALMKTIRDYDAEIAAMNGKIARQERDKEVLSGELHARISSLENTLVEMKEKPEITPREYNLQLEAKYQKSRAEAAIEALEKTAAESAEERSALKEEIARQEMEAQEYMEKAKQMKEKIKKIIEIVE